jgi:hypothetical protein
MVHQQNVYTPDEVRQLLQIARTTLVSVTQDRGIPKIDKTKLSPFLLEERACFVTLTHIPTHDLRGCTGTLVARNPLAFEVAIITEQTALSDPRFLPVQYEEIEGLHIEISVLTPMMPLVYRDAIDLLEKLRPEIDGVTLQQGRRRATFLPQVWERLTNKETFLDLLCEKMGLPANTWRKGKLEVFTYQSIIIEEPYPI